MDRRSDSLPNRSSMEGAFGFTEDGSGLPPACAQSQNYENNYAEGSKARVRTTALKQNEKWKNMSPRKDHGRLPSYLTFTSIDRLAFRT
jgi:hypothetical protein